MPVLIGAVALLGLAIGSFLNVVIYRLPRQMSLSSPPSQCPSCEHPIRNRHNVPVLGWLVLRGRCADCHGRISIRYPLVELATASLFVAVTWRCHQLHLLSALPTLLIFTAAGVALAMIDVDLHRLPSTIVLPCYPILALGLTIASVVSDNPGALVRMAVCGAGLFSFYWLLNLIQPKGMGYGDVRLSGIIGGLTGYVSYEAALVGAFAAFLIGGVFGMLVLAARRGSRKSKIPFGPFMIAGVFVALFATAPISDFYAQYVFAA